MKRGLVLSLAAVALAAFGVCRSQAATVTVSLDLYYGDSNNDHIPDTAAAGTWQLVARTSATLADNRGIAGLDTALTGVVNATGPTGASFRAPTGAATVGGVAGQAGFQTTYDAKSWAQDQDASATTLDMLFGQIPLDTPNQGLFYDVGQTDAAANKASNGATQPAVTGLGSVVTWNLDDSLGDWIGDANQNNGNGAYQRGVLMAFGRFAAGSAPAIAAGSTAANVFTALGTAATRPANGTIVSAAIVTEVRNNTTARAADFTLDNRVDAADIGALLGGFDGGVADRLWSQGDASGDKRVDAADVGQVLAHFTGDPGPALPGTAKAEYNPHTGELKVSVAGILSWYIESTTGGLTGAAPTLPSVSGALNTDNDARIGQSSFGTQLGYTDHNLGAVAALNLPAGNLILRSSAAFGAPEIEGEVVVIPEPGTFAIAGLAGLALVAVRRRAA